MKSVYNKKEKNYAQHLKCSLDEYGSFVLYSALQNSLGVAIEESSNYITIITQIVGVYLPYIIVNSLYVHNLCVLYVVISHPRVRYIMD